MKFAWLQAAAALFGAKGALCGGPFFHSSFKRQSQCGVGLMVLAGLLAARVTSDQIAPLARVANQAVRGYIEGIASSWRC